MTQRVTIGSLAKPKTIISTAYAMPIPDGIFLGGRDPEAHSNQYDRHLTPGEQGRHETGRSHEQLVNVFRDLIHQQAEVYAGVRSPHEREILPAEAIVHNVLGGIPHQRPAARNIYAPLRVGCAGL